MYMSQFIHSSVPEHLGCSHIFAIVNDAATIEMSSNSVLCVLSHSLMSDSFQPHTLQPGSSVHGDSPGKNTEMGCHALLQWTFPTRGSNPGLPHYRWILYCLSHQESS